MFDRVWRTREGHLIKVSDMTTAHVLNAIRMIEKSGQPSIFLDRLKLELEIRNLK